MLSAWTVGLDAGRQSRLGERVLDRRGRRVTSVPNENWVTTSEIELDDVDWIVSSRGTPPMAFSIGLGHLLGDVGRAGARERRDDRDDRELDVRQELLLEAAPGRRSGDEQGRGEQERDAPLADGDPAEAAHEWVSPWSVVTASVVGVGGGGVGATAAARRSMAQTEDLEGPLDDRRARRCRAGRSSSRSWRWLSSRKRSSNASASGVALTTTWRRSSGRLAPDQQTHLDEPVGELARGRRADPEPGGELGHAQAAGRPSRRTGPWPAPS